MPRFEQLRHQPPAALDRPRELVVVCAPMRSNVNLSRIVRTAGCCGVRRVIVCGAAKIIDKIARDSTDEELPDGVAIETHRSLPPILRELAADGYTLVGLEQTTNSQSLHEFEFPRRTALVVGNERSGLSDDVLALVRHVVEIPVYGRPLAYNAATAASIAMYEYCRQFPRG